MPCSPIEQAKGSSTVTMLDPETDGYGCLKAAADRRPWIMPFNSNDIAASLALNVSETIRGDRNPSLPFSGNKDVSGDLVLPVAFYQTGLVMKHAVGTPTTLEDPTDISDNGTVDIDAAGVAVFGTPQTTLGVGDRLRLEYADGTFVEGYVTARVDDSNMTIKAVRDGATNLASLPQTAATVVFGVNTKLSAAGVTITISGGVGTFSAPQAGMAVGDQVIYNGTSRAYITVVTSTTVVTLVDGIGFPAADSGAVDTEAIEAAPFWIHTSVISPTAGVQSFTLARGFQDMSPEVWEAFTGVKINEWSMEVGGDGELLQTLSLIGSQLTSGNTPYDDGASPDALNKPLDRFENFDAAAEEGGSPVAVLQTFTLSMNNNLDTDTFVIGGQGVRGALPEGIAQVTGSITALFNDDTILDKAQNNTTTSLRVVFTASTGEYLNIYLPEVKFQNNSPAVTGPGGIKLELDFVAFFSANADDSAIVVKLRNKQPAYS